MQSQRCSLQALSDHALVQRALEGNQAAFEELVQRYYGLLFHTSYRYLKEYDLVCDVLQHVFLQLFLSLSQLHEGRSLRGWLLQVARNRCVDELRRRRWLFFSELETEEDEEERLMLFSLPDYNPLPEEVVERDELQQRLLRAIEALPPHYRSVVQLRYVAQLSFSEIARRLNLPTGTVKTQFLRAKLLLRAALAESSDDAGIWNELVVSR
jgi:RNA polymerase sigma-70 factor (ECF subfamily)